MHLLYIFFNHTRSPATVLIGYQANQIRHGITSIFLAILPIGSNIYCHLSINIILSSLQSNSNNIPVSLHCTLLSVHQSSISCSLSSQNFGSQISNKGFLPKLVCASTNFMPCSFSILCATLACLSTLTNLSPFASSIQISQHSLLELKYAVGVNSTPLQSINKSVLIC